MRRRRAVRERRAISSASMAALSGLAPSGPSGAPSTRRGAAPLKRGAPPCVDTLDRGRALLTLITHQHLVTQLVPDGLVDLCEARLEADLGHVPGPRQGDLEGATDPPGPRGE